MTDDAKTAVEDLIDRIESETGRVTAEDIRPYLDHDEQVVRKRAADAAFTVASDDPDEIRPLIDRLTELADEGFIATRQSALGALGAIAAEDPAAVESGFEAYVDGLQASAPRTRIRAGRPFALIVGENPEIAVDHIEDIIAAVEVEQPSEPVSDDATFGGQPDPAAEMVGEDMKHHEYARELAANALVDIVEVHPAPIADEIDDIEHWLDDQNQLVAGAATDVVAALAEAGYDLPDGISERLQANLDDRPVELQARTVRALGHLEATDAIDSIRTLAENTDDEDLAGLAGDTADWLEQTATETPT